MTFLDPTLSLSSRQEAFCRHYTASGNAADAARRAGYAARSARQTGSALLERPWIVERVRRIRLSWKRTERDEARILLARSEQAWDAAGRQRVGLHDAPGAALPGGDRGAGRTRRREPCPALAGGA